MYDAQVAAGLIIPGTYSYGDGRGFTGSAEMAKANGMRFFLSVLIVSRAASNVGLTVRVELSPPNGWVYTQFNHTRN